MKIFILFFCISILIAHNIKATEGNQSCAIVNCGNNKLMAALAEINELNDLKEIVCVDGKINHRLIKAYSKNIAQLNVGKSIKEKINKIRPPCVIEYIGTNYDLTQKESTSSNGVGIVELKFVSKDKTNPHSFSAAGIKGKGSVLFCGKDSAGNDWLMFIDF